MIERMDKAQWTIKARLQTRGDMTDASVYAYFFFTIGDS